MIVGFLSHRFILFAFSASYAPRDIDQRKEVCRCGRVNRREWCTMSLLWLILMFACGFSARADPLSTAPAGCLAPVRIGSIRGVFKLEGSAQECKSLAIIPGFSTSAPFFVDSAGQFCYFPYFAAVSQVQAGPSQADYGAYSQCPQAVTASVATMTQSAVTNGLISSSGNYMLPCSKSGSMKHKSICICRPSDCKEV